MIVSRSNGKASVEGGEAEVSYISLENKLVMQARNIQKIVTSEQSAETKVILLEAQRDYLTELINELIKKVKDTEKRMNSSI